MTKKQKEYEYSSARKPIVPECLRTGNNSSVGIKKQRQKAEKSYSADVYANTLPARVSLDNIVVDQRFQVRRKLDEKTVSEYREIYTESLKMMPPIILVRIDGKLHLVAGFQRCEAARQAGCKTILAVTIDGDNEKAMEIALGSNRHGLKLSDGDKQKAIRMALEWFPKFSNVRIAGLIGCCESYVRKVKGEVDASQDRTSAILKEKVEGADGKMYPRSRRKEEPQNTSLEEFPEVEGSRCVSVSELRSDDDLSEDREFENDEDREVKTPVEEILADLNEKYVQLSEEDQLLCCASICDFLDRNGYFDHEASENSTHEDSDDSGVAEEESCLEEEDDDDDVDDSSDFDEEGEKESDDEWENVDEEEDDLWDLNDEVWDDD